MSGKPAPVAEQRARTCAGGVNTNPAENAAWLAQSMWISRPAGPDRESRLPLLQHWRLGLAVRRSACAGYTSVRMRPTLRAQDGARRTVRSPQVDSSGLGSRTRNLHRRRADGAGGQVEVNQALARASFCGMEGHRNAAARARLNGTAGAIVSLRKIPGVRQAHTAEAG